MHDSGASRRGNAEVCLECGTFPLDVVIASAAKQSTLRLCRMDCFAAFAMTGDGGIVSRSLSPACIRATRWLAVRGKGFASCLKIGSLAIECERMTHYASSAGTTSEWSNRYSVELFASLNVLR
jgi:hypothetical protein